MLPVTPRHIPVQQEQRGQALLPIQRKKAAGPPTFHAAIDEIQIQRQRGIPWREAQSAVERFQKVIADVLFRFATLRVIPLNKRHLDSRVLHQELTECYGLVKVSHEPTRSRRWH